MDSAQIENLMYGVVAAGIGFALVWLLLDRSSSNKESAGDASALKGKNWWEVLELSPDASRDEARAAYLKKIQEFQPENLRQLGPEMRRAAEMRVREINAAFQQSEVRFGSGKAAVPQPMKPIISR